MELIYEKMSEIKDNEVKPICSEDINNLKRAYDFMSYDRYFFYIGDKICHVKRYPVLSNYLINELLGKVITEYFGGKVLKTNLCRSSCFLYLINENFIKFNENYTTLDSGIFPYFKFRDSLNSILNLELFDVIKIGEILYPVNSEVFNKLKLDLKRMFISDFIRKQSDRAFRNFMIKYDKYSVELAPLYDFQYSFLESDDLYSNAFEFDLDIRKIKKLIKKDEQFQELLYKAMDLDIRKVFDEIEKKYFIKLSDSEIEEYNSIIEDQKNEIMIRKLIK